MSRMPELTDLADVEQALRRSRVIAVLGAHPETQRAAYYVPEYLAAQGYRVIPVNPGYVGQSLWGETVRATLREIDEPVDMVDVFRRSSWLPQHLDDLLAMEPRPRLVWLQLGVRNDAFARRLVAEGIDVIQDRCTLADHEAMGIGPVA